MSILELGVMIMMFYASIERHGYVTCYLNLIPIIFSNNDHALKKLIYSQKNVFMALKTRFNEKYTQYQIWLIGKFLVVY